MLRAGTKYPNDTTDKGESMAVIEAVGDVNRVTIACIQPDSQTQMVNICYRCSVAGGGDSRVTMANTCLAKFTANYLAQMAPASILYGWKVSSVNKAPAVQPVWNNLTPANGTGANPPAPTQARPLLRFSTAFAGRKYRGRIFLFTPGVAACANTGYPTAALIAAVQALGAALVTNIVAGGSTWVPVIAHRIKGLPASTTVTDITGYSSPGLFGTQRRSGNTGRLNPVPW